MYFFGGNLDLDFDGGWTIADRDAETNTPNARPITVSFVSGGQTFQRTDNQGFIDFSGNFDITENGTATNTAFYLSDSWRLNQWLFDASRARRACERLESRLRTLQRGPRQQPPIQQRDAGM